MPAQRDRLLFKYTGENGEHYMGIPARDLYESDRASLSDEQMATLGMSAFYRPRNDADEAVAAATKRVERAEPVAPMAEAAVAEMPEMPEPPAPKEAKKS
jgi:hypothetical protein